MLAVYDREIISSQAVLFWKDSGLMAAEQFAIRISDVVLADLAHRLDITRWPDELENTGWEFGSNLRTCAPWLSIGGTATTGDAKRRY